RLQDEVDLYRRHRAKLFAPTPAGVQQEMIEKQSRESASTPMGVLLAQQGSETTDDD
ncbi:unnamed protein product, partial [Amoebophrya sp. A25]